MLGQTNKGILGNRLPQKLRASSTKAERLMWRILRDRQFSEVKFRRQHPFNDYILDFVCLESKLVIELDGSQHQEQTEADLERSRALKNAGFSILRFWNNEVLQQVEAVKEKIWDAVRENQNPHPHPGPPLEGEGEAGRR